MKLFGIDISIHWSWWIFVSFYMIGDVLTGNVLETAWNIYFMTMVLGLVIGHELSHALAAKFYGYETTKIIMHLLGGVALINMSKMKPKEEFWIALAGPMFNITLCLTALTALIINPINLFFIKPEFGDSIYTTLGSMILYFCSFNAMMGFFNLIPAYPMDGGRILRSLLSSLKPRNILNISNAITVFFAAMLIIFGFYVVNPFMIILAGILLFLVWAERKTL